MSVHRPSQRSPIVALLSAALAVSGCATGPHAPASAAVAGARPDLVPVSRGLTSVDAAERRGDAEPAVRLAQAAALAPGDAAAHFLAVSAEPPGDRRWSGFRELAGQFPRSALPWVGMGRSYVAWRTWDQADRAIAAALQREPDNWLAVRLRAQLAEARGQPGAAAADYQAVLACDPQNPEAHLGLARLARAGGDMEGAHAHAAAALDAARELPGAWAILADLSTQVGEPALALDFWKGAVAAAPRDRDARLALARLLREQGDASGAAREYAAAAALQEDAQVRAAQAEAARAASDPAGEAAALERLARLQPATAQWRRVGELRAQGGDLAGAERAFTRALETEPHDAQAHLGLARVHLARDRTDAAVRELRAAGEAGQADLAELSSRLNLQPVKRPDHTGIQLQVQSLVERTYRARLAGSPSLSGSLRLRVSVDAAGEATTVEVLEDTVHDADVLACASWNLRDAIYPSGQPGRYTFTFQLRR